MTILQTKFNHIPVVIENITASAHISYYAHITPSYPTLEDMLLGPGALITLSVRGSNLTFIDSDSDA